MAGTCTAGAPRLRVPSLSPSVGCSSVPRPQLWRARAEIKPLSNINFNSWVTPELKGIPIKMDDKELDKANPKKGRHATNDRARALSTGGRCSRALLSRPEAVRALSRRPAAAHSLCGDGKGNLLVGTVCNEIYELRFDTDEPPFCYMQGYYDELWGLATHPSKLEFCTAAEDETLRVWDMAGRRMRAVS